MLWHREGNLQVLANGKKSGIILSRVRALRLEHRLYLDAKKIQEGTNEEASQTLCANPQCVNRHEGRAQSVDVPARDAYCGSRSEYRGKLHDCTTSSTVSIIPFPVRKTNMSTSHPPATMSLPQVC